VAKRMARCRLHDPGFCFCPFKPDLDIADGNIMLRIRARKEPYLGPVLLPVFPKRFQGHLRQQCIAVLVSLALIHADQHAFAVDIGDPEAGCLSCPKSGRVGHHQHRLLLEMDRGLEYSADIAFIQNMGKRLDGLGVGYPVDDPAFAQGRFIEKTAARCS
jgi:hypothetical protein